MRVDVLDLDRRFVHQHTHRERQSRERHDVDGLPERPEEDHGRKKCSWNRQDDNQRATPIPEK